MNTTEAIGRAFTAVCAKINESSLPEPGVWFAVLHHLDAAREAFESASRVEFNHRARRFRPANCACGPDGVCAECYPADAPGVLTHPCCTGTAVLAGRACPRCSS